MVVLYNTPEFVPDEFTGMTRRFRATPRKFRTGRRR